MIYVSMLTPMSHAKEALQDARRLSKIVFHIVPCMMKCPWVQKHMFRNTNKHNDKFVSCLGAILDMMS